MVEEQMTFLTEREAAYYLGISVVALNRIVEKGEMEPYEKIWRCLAVGSCEKTMEDQINITIRLPPTFARHYRQVITRYLAKGWWQLSPSERRAGFEAFSILHAARVQRDDESLTFQQIYDVYVDRTWSDRYIDELLALSNPAEEHSSLH